MQQTRTCKTETSIASRLGVSLGTNAGACRRGFFGAGGGAGGAGTSPGATISPFRRATRWLTFLVLPAPGNCRNASFVVITPASTCDSESVFRSAVRAPTAATASCESGWASRGIWFAKTQPTTCTTPISTSGTYREPTIFGARISTAHASFIFRGRKVHRWKALAQALLLVGSAMMSHNLNGALCAEEGRFGFCRFFGFIVLDPRTHSP